MTKPDLSMLGSPDEQAARYREMRRREVNPDTRWFLLIKELRARHGFGIFEAERMALRDPALQKWVEKQINTQPRCRKLAVTHIRSNGEASLIKLEGGTFKVLAP